MSLFKADPSSAQWKVYVDYIDEMVIDGFYNAVESSLKFFLENTGVLLNSFLSLAKNDYRGFPSLQIDCSALNNYTIPLIQTRRLD